MYECVISGQSGPLEYVAVRIMDKRKLIDWKVFCTDVNYCFSLARRFNGMIESSVRLQLFSPFLLTFAIKLSDPKHRKSSSAIWRAPGIWLRDKKWNFRLLYIDNIGKVSEVPNFGIILLTRQRERRFQAFIYRDYTYSLLTKSNWLLSIESTGSRWEDYRHRPGQRFVGWKRRSLQQVHGTLREVA